jgi:hypothetical protein
VATALASGELGSRNGSLFRVMRFWRLGESMEWPEGGDAWGPEGGGGVVS